MRLSASLCELPRGRDKLEGMKETAFDPEVTDPKTGKVVVRAGPVVEFFHDEDR